MNRVFPLHGLYAVTNPISGLSVDAAVQAAIAGGASMVQYRDKSRDQLKRREEAQALQAICQAATVPLIINDDVDLALQIGAAGVHLGRDDGEIERARDALGPEAIIGYSCYNEIERALDAEQRGVDYVAFGSFFASSIKPGAVRAGLTLLDEARQRISLPLATIGGIDQSNGASLIAHGASMIAVISALFAPHANAAQIEAAARELSALFDH